MDPLQRFMTYGDDFEKTLADDDWSRLEQYFAPDAVYTVEGLPPLACEVRGREHIFRAIKKSLDTFDRLFDRRELKPIAPPEIEGNSVTIAGSLRYEKAGLPTLEMVAHETATFDDQGLIVHLRDVYPPGQGAALAWFAEHGQGFDGSYV